MRAPSGAAVVQFFPCFVFLPNEQLLRNVEDQIGAYRAQSSITRRSILHDEVVTLVMLQHELLVLQCVLWEKNTP